MGSLPAEGARRWGALRGRLDMIPCLMLGGCSRKVRIYIAPGKEAPVRVNRPGFIGSAFTWVCCHRGPVACMETLRQEVLHAWR